MSEHDLTPAEEAEREAADLAVQLDQAQKRAKELRLEEARAPLTSTEYARLPAPDETRLRQLQSEERGDVSRRDFPSGVVDPPASPEERYGQTEVGVDDHPLDVEPLEPVEHDHEPEVADEWESEGGARADD